MRKQRVLVTGGSGFIGANVLESLKERKASVILNVDRNEPTFGPASVNFVPCDLLDSPKLERIFTDFQPTQVINLAARTDMLGTTVADYAANHLGTRNVINSIQKTPSVEKVIFTSSQYVVGPGRLPDGDLDYRPHTIYGESKVQTELEVRSADLNCIWTMIRPTNIWGRWHPRYPTEFWRVLKQGHYLHPGGTKVTRCYGYVGTIVDQINTILERDDESLDRKTLYVGDAPIDLYDWTNAFSLELTNHPVRIVPRSVLAGIAKVGDVVIASGGRFPLFSSRLRSMTENYETPMTETFVALGKPRISLEEGVRETCEWLRTQGQFWQ